MDINEIFIKKGEDFFREIEHNILTNYNFDINCVISTGGGTACFYNNLEYMKSIGDTIYLKVSVDEIMKRLQTENKRPLLTNKLNLNNFIKKHINNREKYYLNCDYIIKSDNISVNDIINLLQKK